MDQHYKRRIELNEWIINARWFYMVAVFLIGILGNSLISLFAVKFYFISLFILLLIFIFINAYFYRAITKIKKTKSVSKLKILSVSQIGMELVIFTVIMHFGEYKDLASIFFFLPIITASVIFGIRGAVITALLSGALVNIFVAWDYINYILDNVFSRNILSTLEFAELRYLTISLIKTVVTANFYLVMAIFSGYTSKLLLKREQKFISQAEELAKISKYRENELKQLDKTTKLLVKRDMELTAINKELDKKIKDIKRSEKSMFKAFADLKEARGKSEKESHKIAAIIANFIDPIIVIDKENKLSLLNPAAKDIFGLIDSDLGEEVSGDNNYSMNNFKKIIKKDFQVKTSKELKSNNPMEEEVVINYSGQNLTYKVITAKVTEKHNEYLGIMKIFYNLTREKMIDKLKSEFISIAAHQLRTPLSAIKWVIKMVLDGDTGPLNKDQQQLLFKGYQSNERIINLINDMLNVSRIEEGRFGYSFSDCDFREVLNIVVDSLDNLIKSKNIKFFLNIPKKMPKVHLDRQKMILVLQNLLENAVKYTPEYGKIEVTVEFGKQFLKFKIKDNGVGIPKKDQGKLFSKFFRADNVVRMQTEGSGLGLFIVRNVIKRHGGDLTFQSEEGRGTEFVFTLPLST
jgi:PAS domain S-box-containing protein